MIEVDLTAFGPFGGAASNPSSDVAREVAARHPSSHSWRVWRGRCEVLDVSARACDERLGRRFEEAAAGGGGGATFLHVHLGVHSRAECFRIERKAYNVDDFRIPDNDGVQISGERISAEIPGDAIATTIDCEALCAALLNVEGDRGPASTETGASIRCAPSSDPGRFLCNHVYFRSLEHCLRLGERHHSLFIHVPPFDVMSKELQCETLLLLLDTLCERFEQFRSADKPACESVDSLVAAGGSLSYTPSVDGPATAAAAEDAADTPHRGAVRMKAMLKTAFLRLEPHERQRGHPAWALNELLENAPLDAEIWDVFGHTMFAARSVGLPPAVNGAPGKQLVGALYEVYLEAKGGGPASVQADGLGQWKDTSVLLTAAIGLLFRKLEERMGGGAGVGE